MPTGALLAVLAYSIYSTGDSITKSFTGGALSVLIRHRLALDYVTDGQRVPEDIATADARVLVCRAAQVLKGNAPADDVVMADRFGLAVAHA